VFVTGSSPVSGGNYDYATIAYSATTGSQLWVKLYSGAASGWSSAQALGVSPDGSRVFVTGSSPVTGTDEYATVAYSAATGSQLWVKLYSGPANSFAFAYAIAVSPNGSKVFVAGASATPTTGYDYATVAYSVT
jgi:DNA-binding beta-propeller fold protein YncE